MTKTLWIYPYKPTSKSALVLANELDTYCIKHEGSKFAGKEDQIILNWGAGTGVFNVKIGQASLLNSPKSVDRCINKISFLYDMHNSDEEPRIPAFTERQSRAKKWLEEGLTVIARTKIEGAKGAGLVVMHSPSEFVEASLYTVKVSSTHEYRIYMFGDRPIDVRIKKAEKDKTDLDQMRHNYLFSRLDGGLSKVPEDVLTQAVKAMRSINLFTGGLDILYDASTNKATILEMNTAPYLGGGTAEKYADAFTEWLKTA